MKDAGNYTVTPNNIHLESSFQVRNSESQVWNRSQPWIVRLGYAIIGRIVWPFIK